MLEGILPGQQALRLSERGDLAEDDILALDFDEAELAEYLVLAETPRAGPAGSAGTVKAAYAARFPHRPGAGVCKATVKPARATRGQTLLAADGRPGDRCLLVDGLRTPGMTSHVRIEGGDGPAEYHLVVPYVTVSSQDGYYRLPRLGRVPQVTLEASFEDLQPVQVTLNPDYSGPEQQVDFVLHA